jgi:hypothetical protein
MMDRYTPQMMDTLQGPTTVREKKVLKVQDDSPTNDH